MSVGGGKSSGEQSQFSPYAPMLAAFAKSQIKRSNQILNPLTAQTAEALKTGGVNAQIPIINRAVDASRGAESTSNLTTQEALSRAGLAGTSFGANVMASNRMAGAEETAAIPASVASQFIGNAGSLGLGMGSLGVSSGASAMQGNMSSKYSGSSSQWGFDPGQFLAELIHGPAPQSSGTT
jgi:hypothetical protein